MSHRPRSDEKARQGIPPLRLAGLTILLFSAFSLLPQALANSGMEASFWGAAGGLLVLFLVLRYRVSRAGRVLRYEVVPRPVHYVQLMMHASIYTYWGWYWREVYYHV